MKTYRYYELRDLAWKVLLKSKQDRLPINLSALLELYGITIKYDDIRDERGRQAYAWSDRGVIVLNNTLGSTEQQLRFTTAHELGHILLHDFIDDNIAMEKEANSFAARILMPIGVLNELNVQSAEDIATICNVSLESAQYRFNRLQYLIKRNLFKTSKLECKLIKQFSKFIEDNRRSDV